MYSIGVGVCKPVLVFAGGLSDDATGLFEGRTGSSTAAAGELEGQRLLLSRPPTLV